MGEILVGGKKILDKKFDKFKEIAKKCDLSFKESGKIKVL